ncbi:sodium bile acid symporter family-domain-containing protein [Pelagophyceae sp. CCMP2097]|nr:sodium bile acid symporter family-domain-containing protein [Pelagophyceae sp. CCMP2097]
MRAWLVAVLACVEGLRAPSPGAAQPRGPRRRPLAASRAVIEAASPAPTFEARFQAGAEFVTSQFAASVGAAAVLGVACPHFVKRHVLAGALSVDAALALAMFCAGSSLCRKEVATTLFASPRALLGGVVAQFAFMPALAFLASRLVADEPMLAAGVVLVGCSPGGAASNVVALVARANVALSVAMTASSTLAAGFFTPFLASKLIASAVRVDPATLLRPLVTAVLGPAILGVVANETLALPLVDAATGGVVARALGASGSMLSTVLIAAIVGRVVADARLAASTALLGRATLARLAAAILSLHASGFFLGYVCTGPRGLDLDTPSRRAIAIEVGMQNSALAVVLARAIFGADAAAAALPGALSAVAHSLLGGAVAARWRRADAAAEAAGGAFGARAAAAADALRAAGAYVPDGLSADAFAALTLREADARAALGNLGAWGPRSLREVPTAGSLQRAWRRVWAGKP